MVRNKGKSGPRLKGKFGMRAAALPSSETMKELVKGKEDKLAAKRKLNEVKPVLEPQGETDEDMAFPLSKYQLGHTIRSTVKAAEERIRKQRGEKRVRGEKGAVQQLVLKEFRKEPRWRLKGLGIQTSQPEVICPPSRRCT